MAAKLTKEAMLQFITENIAVYNGKSDLTNIAEADDATIEKAYRAIKTKVWSLGRKEAAPAADTIFGLEMAKVTSLEQVAKARAELTEALESLDELEAVLKDNQKKDLEAQIAELQAQLETLKAEK